MSQQRPIPLMAEELETRLMFAIELDIVALHEFGHSLGLAHYADTPANSIMEAYYNANYNKANLANDVAVLVNGSDGYANLMELFSDSAIAANSTSWKDSLDGNLNGTVNVTYSFVPDGTKLDSNKKSNLFSTMNAKFGSTSVWQALFTEELNRWAGVSSNNLSFSQRSDNGANSGSGAAQSDPNFGDIRIGAHRFDGRGGVLAHAYYPPPNGGSYAGDAHFASEEDWTNGDPLTTEGSLVGHFARLVQTPEGYFFQCTFGEDDGHEHGHAAVVADHDHNHDYDFVDAATGVTMLPTDGASLTPVLVSDTTAGEKTAERGDASPPALPQLVDRTTGSSQERWGSTSQLAIDGSSVWAAYTPQASDDADAISDSKSSGDPWSLRSNLVVRRAN